jgi:hypothetical protein
MDTVFALTPFAMQVNYIGIDASRYLDINTDIYTREGVEAAKEKVRIYDTT